MKAKNIELLAPAKNLQFGKTAINYGADAVYIGVDGFSARSKAGNSLEDIAELVKYAHFFKAKVYAAINILLFDKELSQVEKIIWQLYENQVDAIIIQDPEILSLNLPPIAVHASTQMDNRSVEHILNLEKAGFSRVILARELSLEQIKDIKKQTNIDLECFVHGSLCVCYSGRCFMSEKMCGRSANRGECAQICRQSCNLLDKNGDYLVQNKHLLSLKDLNNAENIEKLIDAGVSSFKIEGRLKDENYVKNIVAFYRRKIDEILRNKGNYQKTSSGKIAFDFESQPYKSFNRGFTSHFFEGKRQNIANINSPKSLGEFLGIVNYIGRNYFELEENSPALHNGDGICFQNRDEFCGVNVNTVEGRKIIPNRIDGISRGMKIYRNFDNEFEKILKNSKTKRFIEVNCQVSDANSDKLQIIATDEDGNKSQVFIDKSSEKAINIESNNRNIVKQLEKSGDSDFKIKVEELDVEGFYPISMLNDLRRQLIENLSEQRLKTDFTAVSAGKTRNTVINYRLQNYDPNTLMTCKYCLKYELGYCKRYFPEAKSISEPLFLETGTFKFLLTFDCKTCEMNIACAN